MKSLPKIHIDSYRMLLDGFEQENKNGIIKVKYRDVIVPIREEMQVFEHMQNIIYGHSPVLGKTTNYHQSSEQIKEFVLVKKLIFNCSVPTQDNYVIYPEIMKSLFWDIKQSARILDLCKNWGSRNRNGKKNQIHDDYEKDEDEILLTPDDSYLEKLVSYKITHFSRIAILTSCINQ
jgi:hypothetical protein